MVYCFAFVLCVIHMQSKDGTNTLAKDLCKQRTLSESLLFFLLLDCREATRYREQMIRKYVMP